MSIIAWIILGLIAGFIGSKIVNKSGRESFWILSSASLARWSEGLSSARSARRALLVLTFTACL